jgi:hypothetical protein
VKFQSETFLPSKVEKKLNLSSRKEAQEKRSKNNDG